MALHINIEDLLSGKAVESNRLDYKEGWNPDAIYRTICAFANDFEDTGGGYIVVGVKEENGHAMRPVIGIDSQKTKSYKFQHYQHQDSHSRWEHHDSPINTDAKDPRHQLD